MNPMHAITHFGNGSSIFTPSASILVGEVVSTSAERSGVEFGPVGFRSESGEVTDHLGEERSTIVRAGSLIDTTITNNDQYANVFVCIFVSDYLRANAHSCDETA